MIKKTKYIVKNKIFFIFFCLTVFIFLFATYKYKVSTIAVDGWGDEVSAYENTDEIDIAIKKKFLNKELYSITDRYEMLFEYFACGYVKYQSPEGAYVFYPGAISSRGRSINGIEGFARFFPLAASWLHSNHTEVTIIENKSYNLIELIKRGLLNGTNSENKEYWGDVVDKDQRIVEAADIALGIWISKDFIWNELSILEKNRVVKWLEQSINKKIVDNNWNLFPITIVKVLEALGHNDQINLNYANKLYKNYKDNHYLGEGWFDDPPQGIDYYNAWSIHYSLFWLDQIDPDFDSAFIRNSQSDFVKFYKYFFSEYGFPIMGRSVCYRLAAPAPIVSAALIAPEEISPGFALRTLDLTWSHFVENDAIKQGKLTQGYFDDDLSLLDGYSGAGSCLWSLRSLIIAFYVDNYIPLWDAKEEMLPIEHSNFDIHNNIIGWTITGNKSKQEIHLRIKQNINNKNYPIIKYSNFNKFKEFLLNKPFRPNNKDALYKNYIYSNDATIFNKITNIDMP